MKASTMKSTLIIVGGFLGAGKTSLLWEAARIIQTKGKKGQCPPVGLITNDQASELVDTSFLQTSAGLVREVSGSCFCCNFNGFADAITYIGEKNPGGVIIAEPVGSCTDLSATIMQPLKERHGEGVSLKPLTVLVDPVKLKMLLEEAPTDATYILRKQLEEADILLVSKSDLLSPDDLAALTAAAGAKWKTAKIMAASAKTGEGVAEWLDAVMTLDAVGTTIAEVDYDVYATGEAAYGWLNASFALKDDGALDKSATAFVKSLGERFDGVGATVGHVKFLLQTHDRQIMGNLTGKADTATLRTEQKGQCSADSAETILTVNARVEMAPEPLERIVLEEVGKAFGALGCRQLALKCLIPGRPNPTYRYATVASVT